MKNSRLSLGTAQFGTNYGVSNSTGIISQEEINQILDLAKNNDIAALDTASEYGIAEESLGRAGVKGWEITSKLPGLPKKVRDVGDWVFRKVEGSLKKLQVDELHCLLLHRPSDLLQEGNESLSKALIKLKDEKIVSRIGISIYSPRELDDLLNFIQPDIIQAPFNILDRSLENSGWMKTLKNSKVEIQARSIFLQGLLLDSSNIPVKLSKFKDLFLDWDNWVEATKETKLFCALNFVLSYKQFSKILVGIDNLNQLEQIIEAYKKKDMLKVPNNISSNDPDLINPQNWTAT